MKSPPDSNRSVSAAGANLPVLVVSNLSKTRCLGWLERSGRAYSLGIAIGGGVLAERAWHGVCKSANLTPYQVEEVPYLHWE